MMFDRLNLTIAKIFTYQYDPRYSRLAGDIAAYEPQLQKRINENGEEHQWAQQAKILLAQAKTFCKEYKIDEGWKCLHAAKRYEFYAMGKQERRACAISLLKETEKLHEWRKIAIVNMLSAGKEKITQTASPESDPKITKSNTTAYKNKVLKPPSPDVLFRAADLKDDDYNNQYYMNRLSRNLFWSLSFLLFIVLVSIVIYFSNYVNLYGLKFDTELNLTGYVTGVLLFGSLGALTSAIISTRNLSKSSRIKEISSSQVVVLSKIFIGAGFSVFIFLLLRSSLAESIKLFSFSISKPLDYFAIAFVSGFTERLAQKPMDLIVGKRKEENSKTPDSPGI